MKSNLNGTSTCPKGQENYGTFTRIVRVKGKKKRKQFVQYDYRTPNGKLFSIVKPTLEECRAERDAWLQEPNVS